jgi:hypothetical protein
MDASRSMTGGVNCYYSFAGSHTAPGYPVAERGNCCRYRRGERIQRPPSKEGPSAREETSEVVLASPRDRGHVHRGGGPADSRLQDGCQEPNESIRLFGVRRFGSPRVVDLLRWRRLLGPPRSFSRLAANDPRDARRCGRGKGLNKAAHVPSARDSTRTRPIP